jgi:hypothetical protein
LPSGTNFGPRPRLVHQALTPSAVCAVCAIRLAAPGPRLLQSCRPGARIHCW